MRWYAYLTGSFLIFQTRKPYKPLDEIIDNPSPPPPRYIAPARPSTIAFPTKSVPTALKRPMSTVHSLYLDNQVPPPSSYSFVNKQKGHRGKFRHAAILVGVAHLFFGHSARVGQIINSAGRTMLQEVPKSAVAWVCVLVRPPVVHDHVEQ